MLLLDLTHTSHTRARTGIQRVSRSLQQHLGADAVPITRDPYLRAWRKLEHWEMTDLASSQGGAKRKAQWPASAKWRGRLRHALGRTERHALSGEFSGLIEPELFVPSTARDFPKLFAHVKGPRIALFMDAIPLRFPELTPPKTVARFPGYLSELLMFDGVAAISEESRDSLLGYWRWLGISNPPPVVALPLGVDLGPVGHASGPSSIKPSRMIAQPTQSDPKPASPTILCVGTLEGRKNHVQLLTACEHLWSQGASFRLHVIGHVNAETGATALAQLRALQAAGRPLRYDGPGTDHHVVDSYAECAFTIYPSIAEGFGLPVIESLARGKPCICSARGALGEISRGGGCIGLEKLDAPSLGAAISSLLDSPSKLTDLATVARSRRFKSWGDYSRGLIAWMQSVSRR